MKMPRPWYRKQNDTWYICRHGKQVPLCKDNRAEAEKTYFQLMALKASVFPRPPTSPSHRSLTTSSTGRSPEGESKEAAS